PDIPPPSRCSDSASPADPPGRAGRTAPAEARLGANFIYCSNLQGGGQRASRQRPATLPKSIATLVPKLLFGNAWLRNSVSAPGWGEGAKRSFARAVPKQEFGDQRQAATGGDYFSLKETQKSSNWICLWPLPASSKNCCNS